MSEPRNERMELLKSELSLLNSRLQHQTDVIWKARQLALLIWSALLAFGARQAAQNHLHADVLLLPAITTIVFWVLEAKELIWYMRYDFRATAIRRFLNQPAYTVPGSRTLVCFDGLVASGASAFPIFDLSGLLTYGNRDDEYVLQSSMLNHMTTLSTLLFYGLQLIVSVFAFFYYQPFHSPVWYILPVVLLIAVLSGPHFAIRRCKHVRKCLVESLRERTLKK